MTREFNEEFNEYRDPYQDISDIDAEEEVLRRLRLADRELAEIEQEIRKDMEAGRKNHRSSIQRARRQPGEARP